MNKKNKLKEFLIICGFFFGITIVMILLTNKSTSNDDVDINAYKDAALYNNGNIQGELITTDVELFETIKNSDQVSIIYIARPTCSFCNKFSPTVQEVVKEYGIDIYYTNMDDWNPSDVNSKLISIVRNFQGTPTILIMYKGRQIDTLVGYTEKENFVNFLKSHELIKKSL